MARVEGLFNNRNTLPPLSFSLFPYHVDSMGYLPAMVTNGVGTKELPAKSVGLPIIHNPEIKLKTESAEAALHGSLGNLPLRPRILYGSPYELVVAAVKLEAARKVLEKYNIKQSFYTTDAVYLVTTAEGEEVTLHKSKNNHDIEATIDLLKRASLGGYLSAVAGIARYDTFTGRKEYYTTSIDLGPVIPLNDQTIELLYNRLRNNSSVALGTSTHDIPGLLVEPRSSYRNRITKYELDPQPNKLLIAKPPQGTILFNQDLLTHKPSRSELSGIGIDQDENPIDYRYKSVASSTVSFAGGRWDGNDYGPWLQLLGVGTLPLK